MGVSPMTNSREQEKLEGRPGVQFGGSSHQGKILVQDCEVDPKNWRHDDGFRTSERGPNVMTDERSHQLRCSNALFCLMDWECHELFSCRSEFHAYVL